MAGTKLSPNFASFNDSLSLANGLQGQMACRDSWKAGCFPSRIRRDFGKGGHEPEGPFRIWEHRRSRDSVLAGI